jgi:hypothetical protein
MIASSPISQNWEKKERENRISAKFGDISEK